ncbi:MAG: carbonic anhydrase [Acidobacteriota bacterium]
MNPFIAGYRKFREEVYPRQAAKHRALAKSQKPHTLFITCADSRVMPSAFTQTEQGELFQCRVVGNLIPAHGNNAGGVTSAIEYAVMVLKVDHIIVCGHSDCGAMRAFQHPEKLAELKSVRTWIEHADSAIAMARQQYPHLHGDEFLTALSKENVISQLQHLKTHPCVAGALRKGALELHGWYYDIGEGTVEEYDEESQKFVPLDQLTAEAVAV